MGSPDTPDQHSPNHKWFDREAVIQTWVNPIVCPVHHQHPKVKIRDGKIGLVSPCCQTLKDQVAQELAKHKRRAQSSPSE